MKRSLAACPPRNNLGIGTEPPGTGHFGLCYPVARIPEMLRGLGFLLFVLALAVGLSGLHPLRPIKAMLLRSGYRASGMTDNANQEHGGSRVGSWVLWPSLRREAERKSGSSAEPAAVNSKQGTPEIGKVLPVPNSTLLKDGNGRLMEDVFRPDFPTVPDAGRKKK